MLVEDSPLQRLLWASVHDEIGFLPLSGAYNKIYASPHGREESSCVGCLVKAIVKLWPNP